MKKYAALICAVFLAGSAYAHGPEKGAHGGRQVDAGDYHIEMVAKETTLAVYINDHDSKPVDAKGYNGTGIFVVAGKPQRIELKHDAANKLTGTAAVPLPAKLKGAVQIKLPSGQTVQAKFE